MKNIVERCLGLFELDETEALNRSAALMAAGRDVAGAAFDGLVERWLSSQSEAVGLLQSCVDDLRHVAATDPSLLGEGPSYDCTSDRGDALSAVCSDPELSALDRIAATLAGNWVGVVTPAERRNAENASESWLREREECLGDRACLVATYAARIDALID